MQKVTLQVPTTKKLRDSALKAAEEQGFSSLQEALRVFMNKLASKEISFGLTEVEHLTPAEDAVLEKRYKEFLSEKKKGRTSTAHSAKEMIEQLNS